MTATAQRSRIQQLWEHWILDIPLLQLVVAVLLGGLGNQLYPYAGEGARGALCDETAHLMTTLLVLNLLPKEWRRKILVPALPASVLIDVDHVPLAIFHTHFLTWGTDRPYTHSLLTVAVALAIAALCSIRWPKVGFVWLGIAIGLSLHFFRDLGESDASGVPLLWPFSYRSFNYGHATFDTIMVIVVAANFLLWWIRASRS
ncbi:MAG: metal-dependent hydrolase [Solirubrobacterales bacterium]|nr:metal-dependent hydrolase [Solirubrobacterales bacterium]